MRRAVHRVCALSGKFQHDGHANAAVAANRAWREDGPSGVRNMDIMPDGKQWIGVVLGGERVESYSQIQIVLNWFHELQERVPVK